MKQKIPYIPLIKIKKFLFEKPKTGSDFFCLGPVFGLLYKKLVTYNSKSLFFTMHTSQRVYCRVTDEMLHESFMVVRNPHGGIILKWITLRISARLHYCIVAEIQAPSQYPGSNPLPTIMVSNSLISIEWSYAIWRIFLTRTRRYKNCSTGVWQSIFCFVSQGVY